jgi:SAM-dependent methyltransferase
MHDTAMNFGRDFFHTYAKDAVGLVIVDIGAQDVNGSLRSVAPAGNKYIGVDFVAGRGVDVILTDPYVLPFENESVDICVCNSCFEHSEFFWLLFNDILRVLKPNGLFYLNVPSNGDFHRYPVDCWRFYPDSGAALEKWGRRSGYRPLLLESFVGRKDEDVWNDYVAVFIKDESGVAKFPLRIQNLRSSFTNGVTVEKPELANFSIKQEDQANSIRDVIRRRLRKQWRRVERLFGRRVL